jgi:hypothetical protein
MGMVQAVSKDSGDRLIWIEIRNPDDHVKWDYVSTQIRPDQTKMLANYPEGSDILLICHGAWGLPSAGDSSASIVQNWFFARPY